MICVDCGACPSTVALVCGSNGSTYNNACEAQVANTPVLHAGACVSGENISCNFAPVGAREPCGVEGKMYCRDNCPLCAVNDGRCTMVGACLRDSDCPAGNASLTCADGGVAQERCVKSVCTADCQ